jgi:DinB family protein
MDVTNRQPLAPMDSARDLVAHFDEAVSRFTAALARADYTSLAQPWAMRRGSQVLVQRPRRALLRVLMMSHLVHHRGQLGVYYPLLGVPVPGMYGPIGGRLEAKALLFGPLEPRPPWDFWPVSCLCDRSATAPSSRRSPAPVTEARLRCASNVRVP